MKKAVKSYISFTRAERAGLAGLCVLLLILIVTRATMYMWVEPVNNAERDKQLAAAWATFKDNGNKTYSGKKLGKKDYQDVFDENTSPLPEMININTADSLLLIRLKGIGPVTAGKIISRRKQHPYVNMIELVELHYISKKTFNALKNHLCSN